MAAAGGGTIAAALSSVRAAITRATAECSRVSEPRLVAVGKTKPIEALQEAYKAGQRVFGENYVQELVEKAPLMPPDVEWHFIGNLQSNKAKLIAAIPNLAVLETIDAPKLADKVNKALVAAGRPNPLGIFVQVNTSGEASKGGCPPEECHNLVSHVVDKCPQLQFKGIMTIGQPGRIEDFHVLKECRQAVCSHVALEEDQCELSMGMSGDFETAISEGSTNIRVGSTIFGARDYPKKDDAPAAPEEAKP